MKKNKHQFHCNHCSAPCDIYKKGKGHRVLVCPNCGVIATNPTVAGKLLKAGASAIPIVGGAVSSIIGDIQGNKAKDTPKASPATHSKDYYAYKEKLLTEALK